MDKGRLTYLLHTYQQQTATPEERDEFAKMLHDKRYEQLFHHVLDQDWNELTSEEIDALEIPNYHKILTEIKNKPQPIVRKINVWPRIAIAAASIVVLFTVGLYFYPSNSSAPYTAVTTNHSITPGENGATLTLSNGKKILVKDALAGKIANELGVKISKTKDGRLIYELSDTKENAVGYNTLSTTRGEQTQVRLQDGTVVFLNAESSITYPTSFTRVRERKVTMLGEAYFEVAKAAKKSNGQKSGESAHIPFIVVAKGQKIEVLGTHFNVSSYPDELTVKTTLLEGSVKVTPLGKAGENVSNQQNSEKSSAFVILKPGEQSVFSNNLLATRTVETDDVIAWKNGEFMFNNETLESIMKKVARWYDVDVIYKNEDVKRKTFFGSISRFANVSDLLNILQRTEAVVFEIKNNQIIADQK